MPPLNICIIGYGGIAAFHCEALLKIDGVRLHTLVGRRSDPAREFAKRFDIPNATTSLSEALAVEEVDAVVVTSPSELHVEQTLAALEADKHVLVEIPMAMSYRGACEVAGAAKRSGRRLMVAHTRRFEPGGRFAWEYLQSGKAGAVLQHQSFSYWLRHENIGWTGYHRSWTDDVVFHHGCHLVDYSLWCVGADVRRVKGELSPLDAAIGTSMDVSLLIRYTNEAIGTISLSYNSKVSATGNRFVCENGTLELQGDAVLWNGEAVFEASEGLDGGVLVQDREFIASIREGREPSCGARDAQRALEVLQQVYDQAVTAEGEAKYKRMWDR